MFIRSLVLGARVAWFGTAIYFLPRASELGQVTTMVTVTVGVTDKAGNPAYCGENGS